MWVWVSYRGLIFNELHVRLLNKVVVCHCGTKFAMLCNEAVDCTELHWACTAAVTKVFELHWLDSHQLYYKMNKILIVFSIWFIDNNAPRAHTAHITDVAVCPVPASIDPFSYDTVCPTCLTMCRTPILTYFDRWHASIQNSDNIGGWWWHIKRINTV